VEFLLQFVFEVFLEFFFQLFGEILLELGWESVKASLGRANHHPVLAAIGLFILGAAVGAAWVWIHPGRLLSSAPLPGFSLLLAPILGGAGMHLWGTYRRRAGFDTTNLATWSGGASFSLAIAIVRFLGTRGSSRSTLSGNTEEEICRTDI
jgi:hypothetical protein